MSNPLHSAPADKMPRRARNAREITRPLLILMGLVALAGCTSIGDLGRVDPEFVTDGIHDWVGRAAAKHAGWPASKDRLTEDERELRDLAFPLIEPPYLRQRWDAVIYEYGINRLMRRDVWVYDRTAYYRHLLAKWDRSPSARYNQLSDDIRNDTVRIDPFFVVARRVADIDRRRLASMQAVADLSPAERANAEARIAENGLVIAWVQHSLNERCASYRFALEHLAIAEPEREAGDVDLNLTQLQQRIANYSVVAPVPRFAAVPVVVAARHPPVAPR
jgi:hypothetical protein